MPFGVPTILISPKILEKDLPVRPRHLKWDLAFLQEADQEDREKPM